MEDSIKKMIMEKIENKYNKNNEKDSNLYEIENIISIIGERGSGKTTSLREVSKDLNEKDNYVIELLEPELCENEYKILEIVMSKLCLIVNEWKNKEKIENKEYEELFGIILGLLKKIKNYFEKREKYDEKDIDENLYEITKSRLIREEIENLLKKMIKYSPEKKEKFILIIDDLDFNLKDGYEIIECVRIFLNIPHLIVLMAFKEEQLKLILKNKFKDIDAEETAYRYIEKIFPYNSRVYMPTKDELKIERKKEFEKIDKLFNKIFNKKITDKEKEELYPKTYRELNNLLEFDKEVEKIKNEKSLFMKYVRFLGSDYRIEIEKIKKMRKFSEKDEGLSKKNIITQYYLNEFMEYRSDEFINFLEISSDIFINISEETIYYKDNIFSLSEKYAKKIRYSLKEMVEGNSNIREKDKELFNKFIDELYSKNKINIFKFVNKEDKYLGKDIEKIKNKFKEEFFTTNNLFYEIFDIIKGNKKIKEIMEKNENLKKLFILSFILSEKFLDKLKFKEFSEVIEIIEILEKASYFQIIEVIKTEDINKENFREEIDKILDKIYEIKEMLEKLKEKIRMFSSASLELSKKIDYEKNFLNSYKMLEEDNKKMKAFILTLQNHIDNFILEVNVELANSLNKIGIDSGIFKLEGMI